MHALYAHTEQPLSGVTISLVILSCLYTFVGIQLLTVVDLLLYTLYQRKQTTIGPMLTFFEYTSDTDMVAR